MTATATAQAAGFSSDRSQREAWLDSAKGLAICLVVFGHATNGLIAADILPAAGTIMHAYYIIYSFHMPLFFFLSGITVVGSLQRGPKPFLRRKLSTLAYPYVVWSIIQGLVQLAVSQSLNSPFKLEYIMQIPISPLGHFWFLYSLLLCHVLAAVTGARSGLLVVAALLAFSCYEFTAGLPRMTLYHVPFYVAGILLHPLLEPGRRNSLVGPYGWASWLAITACFLGLASASVRLTHGNYMSPLVPPIAALGICSVVTISQLLVGSALSRLVAQLGRLSLSIYVMHVMATAGARISLMQLGIIENPAVYLALCTLAGLLAPLAAHALLARLGLLELFGLRGSKATAMRLRQSA